MALAMLENQYFNSSCLQFSYMYYKNLIRLLSRPVLCIIFTTIIPSQVVAVTIEQFVTDSISVHPTIQEQIHVFRQVDRDRDVAISGWRPSVDLEATAGNYETSSPSTGLITREYDSNDARLSVTQNLFNGFNTNNQIDQTRFRLNSALYQVYDTTDNVALKAIQAYLDALKQQRLAELAEINVASHERILAQIKERNESGVGRRSELEQTEGRVARAHASLLAQQNNLEDAATKLHEILGRYTDFTVLDEPKMPVALSLPIDELTEKALANHPAIKVADFNVQAAISDSNRAKSANYPKIDLVLAKEIGKDLNGLVGDTDELSLVVKLSYNFYRGGADSAEASKKISVVHQNQEFSKQVRRQVINTLRLAWSADQSLTRQLKFLKTHIEKAKQTVVSYGEEFYIGQRDLIDLLDAENELNTAKQQHVEAYYDALSSRYRVLEAMGDLFITLNLEVAVGEEDLQISSLKAQGIDTLPLDYDQDQDKELSQTEHCDNTIKGDTVDDYGCFQQRNAQFGYINNNRSPVLGDDQIEVAMNSVLIIPQSLLLRNDTDEDSDELKIISFTQPTNGNVAFDGNKNLIYRSNEGFNGRDVFTYQVTDEVTAPVTAKVKLSVQVKVDQSLTKTKYVNFVFGKTRLTKESQSKILNIVARVKALDYIGAVVHAYTDNIGSNIFNQNLSERRAQAVRKLLVSLGMNRTKVDIVGMGEQNPIADNATPEGRAINRRGEIRFLFATPQGDKPKSLLVQ